MIKGEITRIRLKVPFFLYLLNVPTARRVNILASLQYKAHGVGLVIDLGLDQAGKILYDLWYIGSFKVRIKGR